MIILILNYYLMPVISDYHNNSDSNIIIIVMRWFYFYFCAQTEHSILSSSACIPTLLEVLQVQYQYDYGRHRQRSKLLWQYGYQLSPNLCFSLGPTLSWNFLQAINKLRYYSLE